GGTPLAAIDTDNDGIENRIDRDSDNDGIIDYVETGGADSNGDGLIDGTFTDTDGDGWSDFFDSDNGGTALSYDDLDQDGLDNRLDLDSDNDGIVDIIEAGGVDTDGNGIVDTPLQQTDLDGWADAFDPDNGGTALTDPDSDGDTFQNRIDLDSDNDGIPDHIEFQSTAGYIDITSNDTDNDGIDDAYDTDNGGTALMSPFNKDGTDNPDYLDLDSDNDGIFDIDESTGLLTDGNNDGKTDGVIGVNGLDNLHGPDDFYHPSGNLEGDSQITLFLDLDNDYLACAAGGLDYRDPAGNGDCFQAADDYDNDGIVNSIDLDDDNDGILDTEEYCEIVGMLTYEFYNLLPSGSTVDNIPTTGANNIALTANFDVSALQQANSPGDIIDFSIRFTGDILLTNSDTYTFYLGSDDGSKLFIDDVEIVDHDFPHSYSEKSASVALTAGYHKIKVEYFENSGNRQLTLEYSSVSSPIKIPVPFSIMRGQSFNCSTSGIGNNNQFNLDA
ncbi:PA14 domain-containing protein, partial [Roseivirga sp. E12]|uniref:PA14 domain-containing protein n=1 Tax=Roseivirga sp. E12 TaxID=2819237 RepID=UPI001AFD0A84